MVSMLGRHEGFAPVGELRYLWDRGVRQDELCGCRLPFRSCPSWVEVMADAFGGVNAVVIDSLKDPSYAFLLRP